MAKCSWCHADAAAGEKHAPKCPAVTEGTLTPPEEAHKAIKWLEEAGQFCEQATQRFKWLLLSTQLTSRGIFIVGRRIITPGRGGLQIKAETEVTWRGIELAKMNVVVIAVDELVGVLRNSQPGDAPAELDEYDS